MSSTSEKNRRKHFRFWKLRAGDLIALTLTWSGVLIAANITTVENRPNLQGLALIAVVVAVTCATLQRADLYTDPTPPRTDEIAGLSRSVIIGSALLAVFAAFADWQLGAWEIVVGTVLALIALVLGRGVHRSLKAEIRKDSRARVVIVGVGSEAHELAELIENHPESSLHLVGVIGNLTVAEQHGLASAWLGPVERMVELMQRHSATAAVVTPTGFRAEQFAKITRTLFANDFEVFLSTGITRTHAGSYGIRSIAHEPLVLMTRRVAPSWTRRVKRAMDIVGASVALVLASPVLIATALAIKIEDRGPIFFKQQRAGLNAEFFGMLKFRSMVTGAEGKKASLREENERTGPIFKLSKDPRITRVGGIIRDLSIDELPQLVNVLKGDMSLVGPRPALIEEEAAFEGELRQRFNIRPGMSGLWQVEARSNANFAAYHRLDLHYLDNWSLGLDLRILMATVAQVLESVALMPLKLFMGSGGADAVKPSTNGVVLDLRDSVETIELEPATPTVVVSAPPAGHPR